MLFIIVHGSCGKLGKEGCKVNKRPAATGQAILAAASNCLHMYATQATCLGAQQCGGEDDGVEGHVVLAHELHQLHILQGLVRMAVAGDVEAHMLAAGLANRNSAHW